MQHCALVAQLATRPSWPLNTQCDHHGLSPGVRGVERIPTQAGPPSPPPGTSNKTHIAVQFFNSSQIIPKNIAQLQIPSHPWLLMPLPVHRNSRKHIFQLKLSTKYFLLSTNCSCVFIRWLFQDILRYVWVRFRSDSAMAFDQSLRRRLIN